MWKFFSGMMNYITCPPCGSYNFSWGRYLFVILPIIGNAIICKTHVIKFVVILVSINFLGVFLKENAKCIYYIILINWCDNICDEFKFGKDWV